MRQFILTVFLQASLISLIGCQQSAEDQHVDETGSLNFHTVEQYSPGFGDDEIVVQPASHSNLIENSANRQTAQLPMLSSPQAEEHLIPGTAEWDLLQIAKIQQEIQEDSAEDSLSLIQKNRRIVSLATHAISSSYQNDGEQQIFDTACHALMESLLQMALAGDAQSVDEIYTHASQILQQKPDSNAAINASLTLIKLSRAMAEQNGTKSPWLSEHVKQTKIFATQFSAEEAQAVIQLNRAANFCEQQQQPSMAIECLALLKHQYPQNPFQEQITGQLNRLQSIGQQISITGPSLTGQLVDSTAYLGRPTLVIFWSAATDDLRSLSTRLQHLHQALGYGLIYVNLDQDQQLVTNYLNEIGWHGSHIFHPENSTGQGNPVAQKFGITQSPTIWFINPGGILESTTVSLNTLP